MTATHPPVMPLKPARTGHPAVRIPGTEADAATPEHDAHIATRTRQIFRGALIGLRIAAIAVLALTVYVAWNQNWVGSAAETAISWYTTTIAPHLEVSFVGPEVPTVEDGLVGPMHNESLVVTD